MFSMSHSGDIVAEVRVDQNLKLFLLLNEFSLIFFLRNLNLMFNVLSSISFIFSSADQYYLVESGSSDLLSSVALVSQLMITP